MTTPQFRLSQDYNVLPPKADQAFPIPCGEWDFLKSKLDSVADAPWLFQTIGSTLVGAALGVLIALLTNAYPPPPSTARTVAWVIAVATAACGVMSLLFASLQQKQRRTTAGDIRTQMDLIEQRFERRAA